MALISILLLIILTLFTGVYLFFKRRYLYFKSQGIAYVEPSFPFGNMQGLGSKYHLADILINLYNDLKDKGSVVGFYNLLEPAYLLTDLEMVKVVTVKNFNNFINRGMYVNERDEPLTAHLVAIEDDYWRFLRNKLSPAFTSGKLKTMYPTIRKLGDNLIKTVDRKSKNGCALDVKDLMNRFTLDAVSSVAFGMDSNTLNDEHIELVKISREVFGSDGPSPLYFFFLLSFPEFSKFIGLRQFTKQVSDFFTNVVGGNIKYREENKEIRNDFLNMLIQLKNKGSIDGEISTETKKLTLNECLAQAFVFFFAGSETSSTTISFALTELSFNPDIQEKLREEILEKVKSTNGEMTYEVLHEMTYLNQVVNETLRMYTPGFANVRQASEDFKVPNSKITIKKGSKVFIPTLGFHYDEKYWPNPHKFDPNRFTAEETAKRPAQAFFPFGEGPRNCKYKFEDLCRFLNESLLPIKGIGMRFALVNVKFAVATIIQHFKITPDKCMKYPIKFNPASVQFDSKDGHILKFERI